MSTGFFVVIIIIWLRNGEENTSAWFGVGKSVVEGHSHYLTDICLHPIFEEKFFIQWSSVLEQLTHRPNQKLLT